MFLKTTKQIVMTLQKCRKWLPKLHDGFICATGAKGEKDYGYAAV